jgi:OOP family OmpA-OmpF porin
MQTQILDTGLLRVSNITFSTGKSTILPASYPTLDAVGEALKNWPALKVEVGGHTDASGSDALNQKLSEARAKSVLDYLTKKYPTLKADQYTAVGYGESQPIGDNKTTEGKAMNRRVEFKVLNTDVLKKQVPKN